VEAFGEVSSALSVPAPLIRVVEGTEIVASIRNDLDATLTVNGLCARDGTPCPALRISPAETRDVRFSAGRAGTYHYWASTMGAPVPFRELAGAFVVDPRDGDTGADRVLVITEWTSLTPAELRQIIAADDAAEAFVGLHPRFTFTINGLSWPATERLTYRVGERVKWRIINLSSQSHPMHLHGFYFDVTSLGNGLRDDGIPPSRQRRVVTQLIPSGGTMTLAWTPEREGNWLLHCHVMHHVAPERRLAESTGVDRPAPAQASHHHGHADPSSGMAGMIVGVRVHGSPAAPTDASASNNAVPRKLTLVMRREAKHGGDSSAAGFVLSEGDTPPATAAIAVPGPPIVLQRDEPVEITLVNRLGEATAVHWHGMELDSYYDGVHGWSGIDRQKAPMIEPGGTFVVRFTPPRAGTFIYHTHVHDYQQLTSGLYGPLIVTEPAEAFDPATDHVVVIGRSRINEADSILADARSVLLNGERSPRLVWNAGERHRVRLINITPDDIFTVVMQTAEGPVTWKPLRKDGAPLPAADMVDGPARQTIAVGETYDFEYQAPSGRKTVWLEVRTPAGKWQAQGQIVVK
jgi:FtsP/CotA-like multicopper oxidase with cupredoxin domain